MKTRYTLFLIIITLLCVPGQMLSAGTWVENFNSDVPDSWQALGKRGPFSIWQVKEGNLNYQYSKPLGPLLFVIRSRIDFIGFPLNAKQLRVKMNVVETLNATVGIFLGQSENDRNYKFYHNNKNWLPNFMDFMEGPKDVPNQKPHIHVELKDIEIVFDNGHFELLSEQKHILAFEEPNLPQIDSIGIITYTDEKRFANILVDNFVISGPNVPAHGSLDVRPKDKAAVLWGELKRQ